MVAGTEFRTYKMEHPFLKGGVARHYHAVAVHQPYRIFDMIQECMQRAGICGLCGGIFIRFGQ